MQKYEPLDLSAIIKYTGHLLEGFVYLHQQRIIHRDIKGKNILLDTPWTMSNLLTLVFLNILKFNLISSTSTTNKVGTIRWMAPEVITDQKCDLKVDIRSIGCTVGEILTSHSPWNKLRTMQFLKKCLRENILFMN